MKNWGKLAKLSMAGLIISVFGLGFVNSIAPVQNVPQLAAHGMAYQDAGNHSSMNIGQGVAGMNSGIYMNGMNNLNNMGMKQSAGIYQPDAQMLQQQQVYALELQIEQLKMQLWAMQNMLNNRIYNNMNGNMSNMNNMNNNNMNSNNMNNMSNSGSGMSSNSGGGMSMM